MWNSFAPWYFCSIYAWWMACFSVQQTQYTISHMCNGEKGTLTFVHRSHWCTGSQGPLGLGYGPPKAVVWPLRASRAIAEGFPPTAIAWDVTSYVSYWISGRWRIRCYVTVYVMYWRYKSGCNPVPGSPFASPVAGDLSTPLASWVTVIISQALIGCLWSF